LGQTDFLGRADVESDAILELAAQLALNALLDTHMNDDAIDAAGLFDRKRLQAFMNDYKRDTNDVSLVRKDALVNHLLCLHILNQQYVQQEHRPEPVAV